jgi:hypothetical protein
MSGTPASKFEGPVAVTADSAPFHGVGTQPIPGPGLPPLPLAAAGYVQEEYFVSGEYEGCPYRTSLLVRKPQRPSAFSGVVIVETLHAAGAVPMAAHHMALVSEGHGYAMVASQKAALDTHVKPSDATRYASLDVPSAQSADGGEQTGDSANPMAAHLLELERQEPVSNAILSQVGALLKDNAPNGPFAGMEVLYLVMGGSSQTGATTLRFIRDAHATARRADGSAIYDGYFPALAGGMEPVGRCGVPVIHALGEGDMMGGRPLGYRRENSDDPGDRFRLYEFVGVSHVPTRGVKSAAEIFPLLADASDPNDQLSQFPSAMFYFAALHNLIEWVTKAIPAPRAEGIDVDANAEITRDEHGNARGGVRLSYIDVPFATFIARSSGGDMYRGMIGQQIPISKDKLATLYPTHDDYVTKVQRCLRSLEDDRWLFAQDAAELLAEAEAAPIP